MELTTKTVPYSSPSQTLYTIKATNLSYQLSPTYWKRTTAGTNAKFILKNINCEARHGELTALAGPSGAGKTTLLDILSGSTLPGRVSGQVLINGGVMSAARFCRISGYVTQEDALFPHLTVEETLMYSARLRLHADRETAKARVSEMLKELGLEGVAGARIGGESSRGISGGEKRRVSIGVELVHDPAVVLLDEPTSGLDSASSLHLMGLFKSMAKNQGKTIIFTIHQPGFRILDLIDKVILLSHGVALHEGPLSLLEDWLASCGHCIPHRVNALEYAIDVREFLHKEIDQVQSGQGTPQISDHFLNPEQGRTYTCFYRNSLLQEVLILSQRFSIIVFRTKQLFASKIIESSLAGIVLGSLYVNSFGNSKIMKVQNQVGFFAFTLTLLISSATEALPIFLQEKRIMTRETSRGVYRVSSYVISNMIVFLPFLLIFALLYSNSVYWLVGLRRDPGGFLYFTLIVWMVVSMANSFAACCSALVTNFIAGMPLIYGIIGCFFLFSGYFMSKDSIPKYWCFMGHLSLFKYPFECLLINEFGGERGKLRCIEGTADVCLIYGNEFLKQQGVDESKKWSNVVIMLIFIFGYRFLGLLFLRCRYHYRSFRSTRSVFSMV